MARPRRTVHPPTTYTLGYPPFQTRVTFMWRHETILTHYADTLTSAELHGVNVTARIADLRARGYRREARKPAKQRKQEAA